MILACVLSGMAGNVFAEPVRIMCEFDDSEVTQKPEVEFDDKNLNELIVNDRLLPYIYADDGIKGNVKLIELNAATISWLKESKVNDLNSSFFYKINRKTGRITYIYKSSYGRESTHRGTCTKMANSGF